MEEVSNRYRKYDPRHWILENPIKYILCVMFIQTVAFYAAPYIVELLSEHSQEAIQNKLVNFFQLYNTPKEEIPDNLLAAFSAWILVSAMTMAFCYWRFNSGRNHLICTIYTFEEPDVRWKWKQYYSTHTYTGKYRKNCLFFRVIFSIFNMLIGLAGVLFYIFEPNIMLFRYVIDEPGTESNLSLLLIMLILSYLHLMFLLPAIDYARLIYSKFT